MAKDPSELLVYGKARELAKSVYWLTHHFPPEEKFELTKQIRRSASSVPSNLAEGCSRTTQRDLARFVEIALGSAMELECQLGMAGDFIEMGIFTIQKLDAEELPRVVNQVREVIKMLNALLRYWQQRQGVE